MTINAAPAHHRYLEAFHSLEASGDWPQPEWAWQLRRDAIQQFHRMGFPTARRGNEEWKYTNVRPMVDSCPLPLMAPDAVQPELPLDSMGLGQRLVFVDGVYVESLSSIEGLPQGVTAGSLAHALEDDNQLVRGHLARHADFQDSAFTALNTAFLRDGAYLHVPDGVAVAEPLLLLFLATGQQPDTLLQPRVLLIAGAQAEVKVVQRFQGQAGARYLTNALTEAAVGENASVQLCRVQQESLEGFHVHTASVDVARDGTFSSMAFDLGGAIIRNNLNVNMAGQGAGCTLNGLYLASGSQHVDNQVLVDHQVSHTTTRQLYKGVLDGRSRAVFHGGITVRPDAQKVDAQQQDRNLLLSDRAEADAKPAFWIYADDVRCSHGATCGKLSEDAMFYLRSRGLDEREARTVLTQAFANEVVGSIPGEKLRDGVQELVSARLERMGDGEE